MGMVLCSRGDSLGISRILLCICSQCLAFQRRRPLCPSRWATVPLTLSRNAELVLSSIRSLTPNPASSICCNEHVHGDSLAFASFQVAQTLLLSIVDVVPPVRTATG